MKVYAWLIDLIHGRKNCPRGMISGWVEKGTEHRGTLQYMTSADAADKTKKIIRFFFFQILVRNSLDIFP